MTRAWSGRAAIPWQLRWLPPEANDTWRRNTFQAIYNLPVFQTIFPAVRQEELAPFVVNQFVFDETQRNLLHQALINDENLIAFRFDEPREWPDNMFTWDSGYGPASEDNLPRLWIITGPAPEVAPISSRDHIVVTSTPTPENVLTAAVQRQVVLDIEQRIGTPTPTPRAFVTATPTAMNESTAQAQRLAQGLPFVVTPTPTPLNAATSTANAVYATAVAITTGTWTPLPSRLRDSYTHADFCSGDQHTDSE